ncbi:DUF3006 domain-containing protein [bacterium]|nr:DUF3006 domain-containing protein [bacterium]
MNTYVVVDTVEGAWAVLELPQGDRIDWPLSSLPPSTKEGSVLRLNLTLDLEEEARRRAEALRLAEEARKRR